jgi:GT2 family glycosyltransferase
MTPTSPTKVSISILTHDRIAVLAPLVASLAAIDYQPLEIIVVDNHSQDATQSVIREKFPQVVYIRTDRNVGVAARNLGLEQASGGIVVTLDDDIAGFDGDSLARLVAAFDAHPDIGAINFKVLSSRTGKLCNWVHHCRPDVFSDAEFLTYELTEGAVAFRKEALKACGLYPDYFFLSHEGPDLAFRMINAGYRVIYSPDVTVIHSHSSIGRKNWMRYYYDTRNQFWVAARNYPLGYAMRYLARGVPSMFYYSLRDGFLWYWVKGVVDGIVGLKRAFADRTEINPAAMAIVRQIDRNRPSLSHLIRRRVSRPLRGG